MTTIMKFLKTLFTKPSAMSLAQAELEDAQRLLLAAQTAKEYATQMALYNEARIRRLTQYLAANRST